MKIAVLGAGTWGTALSQVLAENGNEVWLWHYNNKSAEEMQVSRNHPNLNSFSFHENINIISEFSRIPENTPLVIAIPSHVVRETLTKMKTFNPSLVVCASKGIENDSMQLMSDVIVESTGWNNDSIVALSGPSHAEEVCRKIPTAIVAACSNKINAKYIQQLFSNEYFRVYTNTDIIGVEIGGAVKNVIAIAGGICSGLNLGDNTKAALLTRGLWEISRLGEFLGAKNETFFGLSGIGDLIVTAFSEHSRNRKVGELLAKGNSLDEVYGKMNMIAEGINTTKSLYQLSQKHNINMPICEETYKVLFLQKPPMDAIKDLMQRELVDEVI